MESTHMVVSKGTLKAVGGRFDWPAGMYSTV